MDFKENVIYFWDFPGSLEIKTLPFQYRGHGSIPGQGTKIPHAPLCGQKNNRNKKQTKKK